MPGFYDGRNALSTELRKKYLGMVVGSGGRDIAHALKS